MARRLTPQAIRQLRKELEKRLEAAGFAIGLGVEDVVHEPSGLPMPKLAAIHEYGVPSQNIPARAPFGTTLARKREQYKAEMRRVIQQILDGRGLVPAQRFGSKAVADVQESISQGLPPPLSERTLAQKGADKATPLIDTGAFRQSISFEVFRRGDL